MEVQVFTVACLALWFCTFFSPPSFDLQTYLASSYLLSILVLPLFNPPSRPSFPLVMATKNTRGKSYAYASHSWIWVLFAIFGARCRGIKLADDVT